MPFVSNMNDDDENKQNQPQGSQGVVSPSGAGGGAVRLAPSAAVPGGGAAGAAGSGATGATPTSAGGQFGSMGQYLKANMSNAEPLAGKLTSGIGQEYTGLQGQNQTALTNIGNQVSAQPDYSKANDTIAAESANPTSFAGDQGNVASFQNLLKASYNGPTSAESTSDYATQQDAINKSISQGQAATQTQAGRENLLAQNEAKPTTGVTALNSAILSKSPTALASVQDAYKPFQNLLTGLSSGAAEQNKAIADKQAQATTAKQAASDAINSQITGLNTAVGNQLTTAQKNSAAQNAQIKSELAAGTPSDGTLQALGVTRDQWNSLSAAQKAAATSQVVLSNQGQFGANTGTENIDLTGFLTSQDPNTAFSAANVATPEQYQQTQAFQALLNGLNTGAPSFTLNPATAAQAGTAPTGTNSFDYQGALTTAQNATTQEKAAAQAYVDSLQSGADEEHAQQNAADAAKKFGITSAILPGLAGSVPATIKQTENLISHPSLKNLGSSISNVFDAENASAKAGLNTVVNTVKNIFCFHPLTLIDMADGTFKAISLIEVGEITRGGKVLATTRGVGTEFYWYNGVLVTAKHAVKENGTWVRVENSKGAQKFSYLTEVVCNLVTENHRIWSNGNEFADEHETDNYENLSLDESLVEMNKLESLR